MEIYIDALKKQGEVLDTYMEIIESLKLKIEADEISHQESLQVKEKELDGTINMLGLKYDIIRELRADLKEERNITEVMGSQLKRLEGIEKINKDLVDLLSQDRKKTSSLNAKKNLLLSIIQGIRKYATNKSDSMVAVTILNDYQRKLRKRRKKKGVVKPSA